MAKRIDVDAEAKKTEALFTAQQKGVQDLADAMAADRAHMDDEQQIAYFAEMAALTAEETPE